MDDAFVGVGHVGGVGRTAGYQVGEVVVLVSFEIAGGKLGGGVGEGEGYGGCHGACVASVACEADCHRGVEGGLHRAEGGLDFGGVGFRVGAVFDGGYGVEAGRLLGGNLCRGACAVAGVRCGGCREGDVDCDGGVGGQQHVFGQGEEGEACGHGCGGGDGGPCGSAHESFAVVFGQAVDHGVLAAAEGAGEVDYAHGGEGGVGGVGFHPLACGPWLSAEEHCVVAFGKEPRGYGQVGVADESRVYVGYRGAGGYDVGRCRGYGYVGMVDEDAYQFPGGLGVGAEYAGFNHVFQCFIGLWKALAQRYVFSL